MFRDPVASLYVEPRQVYLGDGVRQSGNWGSLHAHGKKKYKIHQKKLGGVSTESR